MTVRKPLKKVTQADIAREVGVSQAVVSLAFGGRPGVISEETRRHVIAVGERLGYRRKPVGKAARPTIAYIYNAVDRSGKLPSHIYDSVESYIGRLADSFARHLSDAGFDMVMRPYRPGTDLTHWLIESNCQGVIWRGRDCQLLEWVGERFPCVAVNRLDSNQVDTVIVDQEEAMRVAVDYLQKMGHRKILLNPTSPFGDPLWEIRQQAFYRQLEQLGDRDWLKKARGFAEAIARGEVKSIIDYWIETGREATALIAGDVVAMRLLVEARSKEIEIPKELSLIAGGNMPDCEMAVPRLTALADPWESVVRTSVSALIDRINHPGEPRRLMAIAPVLVERDSVLALDGEPTVKQSKQRPHVHT